MANTYIVQAEWDAEARVWVAASSNVPGLVTEAESIELLTEKLKRIVPELLEANGCNTPGAQIDIKLIAQR